MKKCKLPRRPKPRSFEEKFARDGEFFGSREKKKKTDYGRLPLFLILCLGGVILTLAVYGFSALWRIREVSAHDGRYYSAATVLECAELEVGDGMLSFDGPSVTKRLKERLPLLDTVKVRRRLNGAVTVSFTEVKDLYYSCHNANYYIIAADTREVLCVDSTPAEARRVGAVYLGLPEATRVRVGEELSFINLPYASESTHAELTTYELETDEPAVEYAYVFEFVETIMASTLADRVTGMELGDRFDIWFVLDRGTIKVKVGNMDELERKLTVTERSLKDRADEGFDPGGLPTLVDVSDPARIIHRTSPEIDMPDWAKGLA